MLRLGRAIAALLALSAVATDAFAAPIIIVAVGASNTSGWGVPDGSAYPEQLQVLLRAKGVDAHVINAGRPLDTTAGMLSRIDQSVPNGTRIAILQPGGNDLRFLGSREQRSANIAAMASRLRARNILVIVFDPEIPPQYYAWDRIHLTTEGHTWIAVSLLPQVMATLRAPAKRAQ
jgi:acyl-CoA thioesterase I